jgi:hypothetical protein
MFQCDYSQMYPVHGCLHCFLLLDASEIKLRVVLETTILPHLTVVKSYLGIFSWNISQRIHQIICPPHCITCFPIPDNAYAFVDYADSM